MIKSDGGPAFPSMDKTMTYDGSDPVGGMSLRDYFAAAALPAIFASDGYDGDGTASSYAKAAYLVADSMLAERERK